MNTILDLTLHEPAEGRLVDPILTKRCDEGGEYALEKWVRHGFLAPLRLLGEAANRHTIGRPATAATSMAPRRREGAPE
jgi:hypothetical protein